jgi:hypothetical protein
MWSVPALLEHIRLGSKWLAKANTPAYCTAKLITAAKSFQVQALEATSFGCLFEANCTIFFPFKSHSLLKEQQKEINT